MSFSFVHISDIHLGRPFSGLSKFAYDEKINNLYKTAVEKAFYNAIEYAIIKNVDFVFIAGDTFDSDEQDFSSKLTLKEGLKKLADADIDVYLICGNHDCVNSYNKNTFNYDIDSKIKIIGLNTPKYLDIDLYNKIGEKVACLHSLSFSDEKMNENPLNYFSKVTDNNTFNIGLLHCDLNADAISPYAPCNINELKSFGYDYWALGHIHVPSLNDDIIQYAGTIQGRNTKETGPHGIRYIKVENNKITKNSFISVDIIRFEDVNIDISGINDTTDALAKIEEELYKITNQDKNSCELFLIRLNLTGCTKFYSELNDEIFSVIADKIRTNSYNRIYISQIINGTIPNIDENILKDDEGIVGKVYNTAIDQDIIQKLYSETERKYKNLIDSCNFAQQDYNSFTQNILKKSKEECMNLCSFLFESESKED